MLLNEILTKPNKEAKTSNKNPDTAWTNYSTTNPYKPPSPNKLTRLGGGIQADAFHHIKSDTVLKRVKVMGESDPAYQFLRIVTKHQNNPYFPKIHNIKVYKQDNTATQIIVKMEKLHDITNDDVINLFNAFNLEIPPRTTKMNLGLLFDRSFRDKHWRASVISQITDHQLKQALRLLEPLFRHYGPDMHFGNIMIRSDGHIVIIDPVL